MTKFFNFICGPLSLEILRAFGLYQVLRAVSIFTFQSSIVKVQNLLISLTCCFDSTKCHECFDLGKGITLSITVNPLLRPRQAYLFQTHLRGAKSKTAGLFERESSFNLAQTVVSVHHKEQECKVKSSSTKLGPRFSLLPVSRSVGTGSRGP